jgi:FAD/FMN-containing dehydrogenase
MSPVFTNWVGTQTCTPARILAPASEADVQEALRSAREVRCVAAGHSFTPVHLTDDTLLTMDGLHGVLRVDPVTGTITALPGTSVGALGEPLWEAGFSLANQGDIDTQGIAGAISTSTHGSGLALRSFSAALRRARLVVASGDVVEIGPDDPRLPAVQACVGMLGVLTEVEVQAVPAHRLVERVEQWPYQEAFGRLDELARAARFLKKYRGETVMVSPPPLVQRALICHVAGILDVQLPQRGKRLSITAVASRQNAIEHIDAAGHRLN